MAALVRRLPELSPGGLGLLFATAEFGRTAPTFAKELAKNCRGTWVLAFAEAIWTEAGELAQERALAGFVLATNGHALVTQANPREFAEEFARNASSPGSGTALLLLSEKEEDAGFSRELCALPDVPSAGAFGGRTTGSLIVVGPKRTEERDAVGLFFPRQIPARIAASSACRLLSPLVRVTGSDGRIVTELDDSPALDLLEQAAASAREPGLLLMVLASEQQALGPLGRNIIARPIAGVDPNRRALILEPEVPVGTRVALATQDRGAALSDLERHLAALTTLARSAAPTFGIFLASERRRRSPLSLEGEIRKVATRFPGLPLIGLTTSLELSPFEGKLAAHVDASVTALFMAVN